MPSTIKFDNTEILSTTYIPRYVKHESVAERIISSVDLAREDGQVLITQKYGVKKIYLTGHLTATTAALLEAAIDTFTELFSRPQKNLDVDWSTGTRRYVASCIKHEFDRDHFNLLFVPWTAEFVVLSGEGKDTAETTVVDDTVLTTTSGSATGSFSMLGSKPARPSIRLKCSVSGTLASVKGLIFENVDTGEKTTITFTTLLNENDYIKIYCEEKKVVVYRVSSGLEEEVNFYGVFPTFKIGTNNYKVYAGGLTNQFCAVGYEDYLSSGWSMTSTNFRRAQSFEVPYGDATFNGISLYLDKTLTPTGNLTVEIQTDSGGKPSGSVVTNATMTIVPADVSGTRAWVTKYSTDCFTLVANTRYWIVVKAAGVDASNYYGVWFTTTTAAAVAYAKGNASTSDDAGSTYTDAPNSDMGFVLRYGGQTTTSSFKIQVKYTKTYL